MKVNPVHTVCRTAMKFCTKVGVRMRIRPKKISGNSMGRDLQGLSAPKTPKTLKIGQNWRQTTSFRRNNPTQIVITKFIGEVEIYTGSRITANFAQGQWKLTLNATKMGISVQITPLLGNRCCNFTADDWNEIVSRVTCDRVSRRSQRAS